MHLMIFERYVYFRRCRSWLVKLKVLDFLGPKPKVSEDAFEDLLGSTKFTGKKSNEPKTIGAMRKADICQDMDPDKVKVNLHFHLPIFYETI